MTSDDEIPLPCRDQSPARPRPALRKRSHGASHISARSNSSDGPFFSSDDLEDASAENYASPRRKKQFKRTWWEPESTSASRDYFEAKRAAKQPKDSGIFMSDNSSNDDGFSLAPSSSPPGKRSRSDARFAAFTNPDRSGVPSCYNLDTRAYEVVSKAVDACLEADGDTVDLSSCQLGDIPSGPLLRLQHLIRPPRLNSTPANDDSFHSLAPHIKLYLSSNDLTSYPGAISSLENMAVLSLRNNQLSELPGSIGRLSNLMELNVAGNHLRWLPFELLVLIRFGQLSNFTARPNPFVEPFRNSETAGQDAKVERGALLAELGRQLMQEGQQQQPSSENPTSTSTDTSPQTFMVSPIFAGRSAVRMMAVDGTPVRGSPMAFSALPKDEQFVAMVKASSKEPQSLQSDARTPSLFELSLRACAAAAPLEDVTALLPFDTPESVTRSLEKARQTIELGGRCCSVCGREFLIPRAEWLEYWFCHRNKAQLAVDESPIPFLRQVCSWNCAQPSERITVESSKSGE